MAIENFEPTQKLLEVKILIYGPSGVGKTVLASTFPKPLFVDCENGLMSVRQPVGRIKALELEDVRGAYKWLSEHPGIYETVVLDSLTEIQKMIMDHTVRTFKQHRPYEDAPIMADWGKSLTDFSRLIRAFKTLDMNVVFIGSPTVPANPNEAIRPAFTGKATSEEVCRMMDVVGYMNIERDDQGIVRRFITFLSPGIYGKDRSWMLPPTLYDPSYSAIMEYWKDVKVLDQEDPMETIELPNLEAEMDAELLQTEGMET